MGMSPQGRAAQHGRAIPRDGAIVEPRLIAAYGLIALVLLALGAAAWSWRRNQRMRKYGRRRSAEPPRDPRA